MTRLVTFVAFFSLCGKFLFQAVVGCMTKFLAIKATIGVFGTFFGIVAGFFTMETNFFFGALALLMAEFSALITFVALFRAIFGKVTNFLTSVTNNIVKLRV